MHVDRVHLLYTYTIQKGFRLWVTAYVDNVYAKFGGSKKILSDNGTEFKNQLFEKVAKE